MISAFVVAGFGAVVCGLSMLVVFQATKQALAARKDRRTHAQAG